MIYAAVRRFFDDIAAIRQLLERYVRIRERDQKHREATHLIRCSECFSKYKEWHYGQGPDWKCAKCGKVLVEMR